MSEKTKQAIESSETIPVIWENYPRAICQASFQPTVDNGGFGRFAHNRSLTPIDEQMVPVVKDVPVDGFWSVTACSSDLYFEEYDAYSVNNVTAERDDDGSVTIHFGGDPDQPNLLCTPEGWTYVVRLYRPRELDGSYRFPEAQAVE